MDLARRLPCLIEVQAVHCKWGGPSIIIVRNLRKLIIDCASQTLLFKELSVRNVWFSTIIGKQSSVL